MSENNRITVKMWAVYEIVYGDEGRKSPGVVASCLGVTSDEVEALLADMKTLEPGLFPEIADVRFDKFKMRRKAKKEMNDG